METPTTIKRDISDVLADVSQRDGLIVETGDQETPHMVGHNLKAYISDLEEQMKKAASNLDFEIAAGIRDQIRRLEQDELGIPVGERKAPVQGRATGGTPGTRTTRFAKAKAARGARQAGGRR